jgi:NAD(P)H-hydrate repair Nnr-like enzyme with NAD(P)H-hydrate epimerase domain
MTLFTTKSGQQLPGVSRGQLIGIRSQIVSEYGITTEQMVESASFCMAMVVRAALGFSAAEGNVTVFAGDNLSGYIALATARHLHVAGCSPLLVLVNCGAHSDSFRHQLKPLDMMQLGICEWTPGGSDDDLRSLVTSSHNAILGICDVSTSLDELKDLNQLFVLLNDLPTPLHCIEYPAGVEVDNGTAIPDALYASSTLSLGAPLKGLNAAKEYVGRHYLCDISIPPQLYETVGIDPKVLFSDQPVTQIFPRE